MHPKQIPVRGLALGGLPTKPEIISCGSIGGQSVRDRLDEQALRVLYEIAEHHRSLSGRLSIEDQHLDALVTAHLRATLLRGPSAAPEGLRLEATLRAQASLITYRRRYEPVPDLAGALRLPITDLPHPYALAVQLACLQGHLESLPRPVAGPFGNERSLIREAGNAVSLVGTANHPAKVT